MGRGNQCLNIKMFPGWDSRVFSERKASWKCYCEGCCKMEQSKVSQFISLTGTNTAVARDWLQGEYRERNNMAFLL